jgi:VWFA-related protein
MSKQSSPAVLSSIVLALSMIAPAAGRQQPAQTPAAAPEAARTQTPATQPTPSDPDDEVVRITSNIVQIDAVFVDKSSGRPLTDIRPEEVEILENGKPQKMTNFSYVSLEPAAAGRGEAAASPASGPAAPVPPVRLRPEQVRRTIALVVDDLGLSFESTHYVRRSLKKFVDEQMQPGDLVAIIRTGGGMGALQQFTSNKQQLYAAIERVRWNATGRAGISAFAPITADPAARVREELAAGRGGGRGDASDRGAEEELDQFREDIFAVGTLGALNYIVRGLRELPGRKSVVLMSDGFRIFNRGNTQQTQRTLDSLRRLTDLANRASVVIYTIDARGLQTLSLTAADNTSGLTQEQIRAVASDRAEELFETQSALNYLAQQTGGFGIRNTNDISRGVQQVLEDQRGFYLIAYRPDESTFDATTGRRRFNKLELRVKRPGVTHRTRTGFYGFSDEEARPQRRTRDEQLMAAITSPFSTGGLRLRLTSFFGNVESIGSYMRSMLHIDANDLTFTKEPDGTRKATIDVIAITFGDNGQIVDQIGQTHNLRLPEDVYAQALRGGFNYTITVPVKKAGAYQLRVALRDAPSERVGGASQFVEVPDIGKNRLTLSGIAVSGVDPAKLKQVSGQSAGAGAEGIETDDPSATAAVRRFRAGMVMQIGYIIYNAQLDRATRRPQVQTLLRLFRDGQQIFSGNPVPVPVEGQADLKRLGMGSALQLGADMPPGEYVLQVVATDPLAREKYRTATQWIDFEIVK